MNAPAPNPSRRRLLTRLLGQAPAEPVSSLKPVAALGGSGRNVFWSLAATAPDNIFLAGDEGSLWHFDGTDWQRENSATGHNLHSLCCIGDRVYAVGWQGVICARKQGEWELVQGGGDEPDVRNLPLFEVAEDTAGTLWAVGDCGRITRCADGSWQEEKSVCSANLRSVLPLADGRVLAGGLGGTLLERSESGWQAIETATGCPIVSMAPLNEDTVVAVGGEYSVESQGFVGRIFLYRDGELTEVDTGMSLPRLRRVRRESDNLLILGDNGAAYRWSATGVRQLAGGQRCDLHDVVSLKEGEALVCGDGEALLQEVAGDVSAETPANSADRDWQAIGEGLCRSTLRALWAADDNHIIAAGDGGYALHYRDGVAERLALPGGIRVHALWGSSPRNIYAACDAATILHFDGGHWEVLHRGNSDLPLLAITGFGPHDIFAVGDSGLALRYDGLMWRQLETPVRQELYGLWGMDSQHLLAVGGGGVVLRFDGERWRQFQAGTEQDLYGVSGSGLNQLYLCGLAGTLVRFQDNQWHREFTGVRADLHAVVRTAEGFVAVGSNGTVLSNASGDWQLQQLDNPVTLQAALSVSNTLYLAGSNGTFLKSP